MKNNQEVYKRVNINWVIIVVSGGFQILLIFLYIHQLGNNPISKQGLILTFMLWGFVSIYYGRIKTIIDDNFVIFRSDVWVHLKIPIASVKNVRLKQFGEVEFPNKKTKKHQFDYSLNIMYIQLINGEIHKINIRNTSEIKEEIEKRMLTTKITSIS
jgi:hypothetical protein